MAKIAVITGANKGLGLATGEALARQGYSVVLVGRNIEKVNSAVKGLQSKGLSNISGFAADVSVSEQVERLAQQLGERYPQIDVLINNAGVILSEDRDASSLQNVSPETVMATFNTNCLGAYRCVRALLPLLKKSAAARIVNVSSGLGQLSEMGGGYPAYRISKTAMNGLTTYLHAELSGDGIKVNSVCPGWVRTDLGGGSATRSIDEGIQGIVWAATLPNDGPSGGYFRDGKRLDW